MWTRLLVFLSRCRALLTGGRLDADLGEELESHLAMLVEENVRRGMAPDEARRLARLRLGGPAQIAEAQRDQRSLPQIEITFRDLRYACRVLRRSPGFTVAAVLTLAVGIGASTAIFSIAGAVLLRPLPYQNPSELVRIFETNPLKRWTRNIASPANYADWKAQNTVFTDVAAYEQFDSTDSGAVDVFLTGFGEPQPLKSLGVTGNLFRLVGTAPLLGRTFTDDETFEGKGRVAVLSYGLWRSVFGGDPGVIGKTVVLSGRTYDVVGVMPREFFFPGRDVQIWLPVAYSPSIFTSARRPHWLGVVARRRPGVSLEQAQQEMSAIAARLEKQYPDTNTRMGVRLEDLHDSLAYASRPALLMLSGAVGLLFVIVCVNIAGLQLGRGVARARELAIRRALGAERRRLVRQLLTEGLVVSLAGGVLGLALAALARAATLRFARSAVPLFADLRLDWSVVVFAAGLSVAAPMVFGVLPALASSRADRLNERAESGSRQTSLLRNVFVAGEVALAIILVVGAVLLVRSLVRLQQVDPGFDAGHGVAFTITLPSSRYPDAARRFQAFAEIERRLRDSPGVEAVGASSTLALRGYAWTGDATVEGRPAGDYERELRHESTTPGYFRAMGVRLVAGRSLDERDRRDLPPVTLVNEALAAKYFRGGEAVGRRIKFGRPQDKNPWVTIVGVVADQKQDGMDRPVEPEAYVPLAQQIQNPLTFVVRTRLEPDAIVAAARREVRAVDKDLALTAVTTLKDLMSGSLADHRFRTAVLSMFAGVALLLAALGVYGVLAYLVSQRSRELGIRLALGATPRELFRLVVGQGMRPVAAGAALGVAGALGLAGAMRSLLFGIEAIDPSTYALAIVLVGAVGVAACAGPARRATRVDPLVSLRQE